MKTSQVNQVDQVTRKPNLGMIAIMVASATFWFGILLLVHRF